MGADIYEEMQDLRHKNAKLLRKNKDLQQCAVEDHLTIHDLVDEIARKEEVIYDLELEIGVIG